MAERTNSKDEPLQLKKAYLVGLRKDGESEEFARGLLDELAELVENIGFDVAGSICVNLREPNPHYLVGAGKFAEIRREAKKLKADCIVFDDSITPAQQRNWEHETRKCVIDRQEVILEIFARRATTKEARLQVELARLVYSLPRLKRAWTHLSRQRGGGVTQRGAGESQLETDRRRVVERISRLKKDIELVGKVRATQRKRRDRSDIPTVAIVGYTNAGKSSLMNYLSGAGVLAENKLFATLDPTTRELKLPSGSSVLITDTVGFVRRLPHNFIDAFKSTLEEAAFADLLIHVVDASNSDAHLHVKTTMEVLSQLGANEKPCITLLNKIDAVKDPFALHALKFDCPDSIEASIKNKEGMDELIARLEDFVSDKAKTMKFLVPHSNYKLITLLEDFGAVRKKAYCHEGVAVCACVPVRFVSAVKSGARILDDFEFGEIIEKELVFTP